MRVGLQAARPGVAQAPRHAEVNQENATRFEPDDQVLAPSLDGSVRIFRHGTDYTIIVPLATPNGGEMIPPTN